MITRLHQAGETASEALYSDCQRYRYALTRVWDPDGRRALYVMLNPSTADERQNDPTVERCERRARAGGFGAFRVVNLFAWRATDPKDLRAAVAPEGAGNIDAILQGADWSDQVVCGWGVHGAHRDQGARVEAALRAAEHALYCLGVTKDGHPRHPLYVAYAITPQPWSARSP